MRFAHTVGLIFVILKITNQLDWDWFYVLLPFWWQYLAAGTLFVIFFPAFCFFRLIEWAIKR